MGRWGERDGGPDAAKKSAATTSRLAPPPLHGLSVIRFIAPVQQFLLTAMGKKQLSPPAAALPAPDGPARRSRVTALTPNEATLLRLASTTNIIVNFTEKLLNLHSKCVLPVRSKLDPGFRPPTG